MWIPGSLWGCPVVPQLRETKLTLSRNFEVIVEASYFLLFLDFPPEVTSVNPRGENYVYVNFKIWDSETPMGKILELLSFEFCFAEKEILECTRVLLGAMEEGIHRTISSGAASLWILFILLSNHNKDGFSSRRSLRARLATTRIGAPLLYSKFCGFSQGNFWL